jgi:site-specific DNA recombinase
LERSDEIKASPVVHDSDSTLGGVVESMERMKKAVLYARVSTEAQQKEGTIESQVQELKRQISTAGNALVKEYIDNGYSGAKLDRPALEQLRQDVKTDLFEVIYFLNTDRIARDVAYQTIIVGELLKHDKQIIINGKDYIHNPENKFTLTVLGAVAELERAKIMERLTRGKLHRLRMGHVVGHGVPPYGYMNVKRTPTNPSALVINEEQTSVVLSIFEMYASGVGLCAITRWLEENEVRTQLGRTAWDTTRLKNMLTNHTYAGTRYFNAVMTVPSDGKKRGKYVPRARSEWIGVKVPAIVSQDLFDKVQERLQQARQRYCHPPVHHLFGGGLLQCGHCGSPYYSYRRYLKETRKSGEQRVVHKSAYECLSRGKENMHSRKLIDRCRNSEIATHLLEDNVFEMIRNFMLDPSKLRGCIKLTEDSDKEDGQSIGRQLARVAARIKAVEEEKRRLIELYAAAQMPKDEYVKANIALDDELDGVKSEKAKLDKMRPRDESEAAEVAIRRFSESAQSRFEACVDFDTKRQFLLEHIEKVIFLGGMLAIIGSVPVEHDPLEARPPRKLQFQIAREIDRKAIARRPKKLYSSDPRWKKRNQHLGVSSIAASHVPNVGR